MSSSDELCMHNEVERFYFHTACESYYATDEVNERFVFCPYCGKEIDYDE